MFGLTHNFELMHNFDGLFMMNYVFHRRQSQTYTATRDPNFDNFDVIFTCLKKGFYCQIHT